jgi:ubiquinone/menaquinone biosynthesis C-methylase UbiE
MPDYFEIYNNHADQYEALVSREDYQHNLFRTIGQIVSFDNLKVVEFGAGTGRLTCMLAPIVKSIHAYDSSQHMLDVAIQKLRKSHVQNWQAEVGDHRHIPMDDGTADVAISGWSMCYLVVGNDVTWQSELDQGLTEMQRVVHPGGMLIIVETLGTGHETPVPPDSLKAYFDYLEKKGFQQTWIRTDYLFQDNAEANTLTRFFFGDEMVDKIRNDERGVVLPECTGIWWRRHEMGGD